MRRGLFAMATLAIAASAAAGGTQADASLRVRAFLQSYVSRHGGSHASIRYAVSFADLNGDGRPEAIVYLTGPDWCGSGGCKAMVLTPAGRDGYRPVMSTTVTRTPIKLLSSAHKGWRDIGVGVAGGGVAPAEVALAFDGRRYPSNPTLMKATAHPLVGRILIRSQGDDASLFP